MKSKNKTKQIQRKNQIQNETKRKFYFQVDHTDELMFNLQEMEIKK